MARCEVCGNDDDMAFDVVAAGQSHTFDSFECAIQKMAPVCEHCGCKVVGHEGSRPTAPRSTKSSNQKRAFVAWRSEEVQLGSWHLAGGDNVIVVSGKTRPHRANARLVLEIDASL